MFEILQLGSFVVDTGRHHPLKRFSPNVQERHSPLVSLKVKHSAGIGMQLKLEGFRTNLSLQMAQDPLFYKRQFGSRGKGSIGTEI